MTYSPAFLKAVQDFMAINQYARILIERRGIHAAAEALRIMLFCEARGEGEEAYLWQSVNHYLRL